MKSTQIDHTAVVHRGAELASNVTIGPYTIIHPNVIIKDGSVIGSHCELGLPTPHGDRSPLIIGHNAIIRSHSIFYESSTFGDGLTTGHRVTVRERTIAGDGLQIGTLGDIQGHCRIGNYVRFHSSVHVGQQTHIQDFVWVFPFVVFTNDPHPPSEVRRGITVKKFAAIATMTTILPGIVIGEGALVGACSAVTKNVEDHRVAAGNPARDRGPTSRITLQDGSDRSAYPWVTHFHRGYPEDVVRGWLDSISTASAE